VFNKFLVKGKNGSFYVAVPIPAGFENNQLASLTLAFQFGIASKILFLSYKRSTHEMSKTSYID